MKRRLSETEEDYLRAIYELTMERRYATVSEIANRLKVRPPSVTDMVKKLADGGFVEYTPYRPIVLTEKGRKVSEDIFHKHTVLRNFLKIIGVKEDIAEEDACGIEHHLHTETINRLTKFVEFVENMPKHPRWLEHYEEYIKSGKLPDECLCDEKN
jgi:DtxR family Mn-dependent transcriptional regulator